MNENDARFALLVRAVELADRDSALLTREDRQQADEAGKRAMGSGKRADQRYLAARAQFAAARLTTRHPPVAQALTATHWPPWIGWVLPLAALVLGIAANELGNSRRLDLLAAPLLGTFAWNVLVYLWIASTALRRRPASQGLPGLLARLSTPGSGSATPLARALGAFLADWHAAAAPLNAARAARAMHLAAATFALGLVAGIYLRALAIAYRAGWESTLLSPGQVHGLLSLLLGPASALTGIALPDPAGIAALRITGTVAASGDARPWLHLFATTVGWLVIVPRLALALFASLSAAAKARAFPVPGREDFYTRRLLREAQGGIGQVRITPYAYAPDAAIRARLGELLREAMGAGTQVRFDEPVAYGAEEDWLARAALDPAEDLHLLLFALASTPEDENHGAFARDLAARLAREGHGTVPRAIVDHGSYRARLGDQPGSDERLTERQAAWDKVLAAAGLQTFAIDLARPAPDDVSRIETLTSSDAQLEGARRGR